MGDLIVGLDGWRVRNNDQYFAVNDFNPGPDMRLHVWQKDRYVPIEARLVSRRFGVNLKTFP